MSVRLPLNVVLALIAVIAAVTATATAGDSGGGVSMSAANSEVAARLALKPMVPPLNDKVGPIRCSMHTLTLAYCNASFTGGQPLKLRVYVQYIAAKDAYKVWARIRGVSSAR